MPYRATATDPGFDLVTHNLIHRPTGVRVPSPGGSPAAAEHFLVAGPLPDGRTPASDAPGAVPDSHTFVRVAEQVGVFIANHYFRVPADRPCVLYKLDLQAPRRGRAAPGPAAGRGTAGRAHMSMDVCARPRHTVGRVPRALRFEADLHIDGVERCSGAADLVFLTPRVHRGHRASSRRATLAAHRAGHGDPAPGLPTRPCDPPAVGCAPWSVLLAAPRADDSGLTCRVLVDTDHPVYYAEAGDSVPGPLQTEAVRQMALLAAAHFHGFDPARTDVVRTTVHFRAYAENDLPLTCTAAADPQWSRSATHDAAHITVALVQQGRTVAEATVTTAQAC